MCERRNDHEKKIGPETRLSLSLSLAYVEGLALNTALTSLQPAGFFNTDLASEVVAI